MLGAFAPSRFPYRRFALALLIGAAGGWLFATLQLPLPWMLGAMTACTVAALAGAPVESPRIIRPPMSMTVGVLLGAGFSPEIVSGMPSWWPTLLGVAGYVLVAGLVCVVYFRLVGGFDLPTAYFAGMPGGLVEMVLLGEEKGGDAKLIALTHAARILLVIFTLPFAVRLVSGVGLGARPNLGASILETPWTVELWLVVTGVAGVLIGRLVRLPSPYLLGPMLVSAAVHAVGWTEFRPPVEIVGIAQVVLGVGVGARFAGAPPELVGRILLMSVGSTLLLLLITFLFAFGFSRLTGFDMIPLALAYSPGGVSEMSLVALALQIDVAFVTMHHIVRVLLVTFAAGLFFRAMEKWRGPT